MNKISNNKSIPCHYPWTSIYVSPNGDIKHCCGTNLNKLGNLATQSIEEIWNGVIFQNIREKISKGDFNGAYCNPNCQGLRTGKGYAFPEITKDKCNEKIANNKSLAKYNFENKNYVVDHKPVFLQLEFSNRCNLRCIMCFYEFKTPYQFIPDVALDRLLEISNSASGLTLMGGEVFFNKQDLKFIDNYSAPEGAYVGFVTNGTLLNEQMLEKLKKLKKMYMQISIDATSHDIYQKVRRNGNWETVDANINRLKNMAKELSPLGYDWNFGLAFVVLKTNISNIANSIDYAIKLNVNIGFHPVKGFHLYNENIFVYKNALKNAGNWKLYMKEAFEIIEKNKNTYNYYNSVLERLQDIEQCLNQPKINVSKTIISLLYLIVPGAKKQKNQTGLTEKDRKVGHLLETYYNWRVGNVSFKLTFKYILFKAFKRKHK